MSYDLSDNGGSGAYPENDTNAWAAYSEQTSSTRSEQSYDVGEDYNYQYKLKIITGIRK